MIKLGSLFSGIGGFELGLSSSIPGLQITWQVEIDKFCQSILKKHWPESELFTDVKEVGRHNLKSVDILCGGFPCQDISKAGKGEGLDGKKSSLWFEMWRIISELRPRIVVMENVANINISALSRVAGSLSEIGYDCEWKIISASDFGAPHQRRRWFGVAYPKCARAQIPPKGEFAGIEMSRSPCPNWKIERQEREIKYSVCGMDDGVPQRTSKLRALGNAVMPQCAELVGQYIYKSGLLDDLY